MALNSPGVEVTVIDESFYTPAEPGTTPLIVVATAQDKTNGAGTGTASATLKANVGKALKITSQRELTELYGVPYFEKTASSTPVHGSELNEYGLLAAYSLLGVSNAAFVVRADVDLGQLEGQTTAPGANPSNGAWWLDTQATAWGIQEWNGAAPTTTGGQKFTTKLPIVLTDDDEAKVSSGAPKGSVGAIGDYAVVFQTVDGTGTFTASRELATIWYKSAGNGNIAGGGTAVAAGDWVKVGSNAWQASHPAVIGTANTSTVAVGTNELFINGTAIAGGSYTVTSLAAQIRSLGITGVTAQVVNNILYVYTDGTSESRGTGDSSAPDGRILLENGATTWSQFGVTSGEYIGPLLQQTPHTSVPTWKRTDNTDTVGGAATGSVWVKTTEPNQGARWRAKRWDSGTLSWVSYEAPIYANGHASLYYLDRAGGGVNISANALYVQSNADEHSGNDSSPATASFRVYKRAATGNTTITSTEVTTGTVGSTGSKSFNIAESIKNSLSLDTAKTVTFTAQNNANDADSIAEAINSAGFANVEAAVTADNELQIFHKLGGEFRIVDTDGVIANLYTVYNINTLTGTANFYSAPAGDAVYDYVASNWQPLAASNFNASNDEPLNEPTDGQLWYNPQLSEVDIMIHNGNTWVGYRNTHSPYSGKTATDALYTPSVSASNPYVDGQTETGDLWISTADLENYPTIYKYNSDLTDVNDPAERWELVDKTDQTTEEGILFADARYGLSGATGNTAADITDLIVSNYLDTDAPDPALYPKGMLLWNLRRSGGNVKRYANNYVDTADDNARYDSTNSPLGNAWVSGESMDAYATDRWVTASANNEDGSGSFLRKAQRAVVVSALKSVVDTSSEIRDEEVRNYNLIACPGYPELLSNLVNLNIDRGITAFVVGDTPLRLASDATTLTNWGSNTNLALDNGETGLVTYDEYAAVFYPNGFTTDLSGANAVVPASHMMLRTIALSDNASYPWFAPAGTRRGGITNATAVGYLDSENEFQTVALNEGQRDTLYDLKVNPITFFNGVGLVNYGQKTRARNASALDRINVARLTVYLRSQLQKLARPYIFEPNDKITRDEIKQAVESLLLELVGLRALFDFAVVCDETNNTPARIDRNELWVDVAIEPVKAVEFIYIPLRVKNTGEI